jgi:membrane protein DedA with SNARE-associated domain
MGYRFESITKRWFGEKNIKRAQKWFHKYGKWSITISRPISIANYITYLAGLSKIKSKDFVLYSTLGIFPWFVFLLYVGGLGDIEKIQKYLHDVDRLIIVILIIGVTVGAGWWMKKRRESHAQE